MLAHAYDAIDPKILWRILLKDIPLLKMEIKDIKNGNHRPDEPKSK
jgi:uncharacterized protein with HEPN domain